MIVCDVTIELRDADNGLVYRCPGHFDPGADVVAFNAPNEHVRLAWRARVVDAAGVVLADAPTQFAEDARAETAALLARVSAEA